MSGRRLALGLLLASLGSPLQAESPLEQLQRQIAADNRAYQWVASLTTEVGPRLAGTPGDAKAVAWAQRLLREQGFAEVRAEPVRVPRWNRREVRVSLAGDAEPLAAVALGGSEGGQVQAPVLRVESVADLQARPLEQVRGRIVFFDRRMERTRDGSGYGPAVDVRVRGAAEAARRGAVGAVIRSIGTSSERVAHTGTLRYDSSAARIPAVALANRDADRLAAQLAQGAVTLSLSVGARYLKDAMSANVIGEIPGETDEIVLLGAHLDSWDVGTGANDDGAGVAIVIEAARQIARLGIKPRRTLRVVLFANEEFGLSGAKAYARAYAASLDRHVLAMEADFGSGAVFRLDAGVDPAQWPAIEAMARALAPFGVALGRNGARGGADLTPLRERGVPVLDPRQDGSRYFDLHHTAADTLESIDRAGLEQNVAVYAIAAWLAAQHPAGFGRLPRLPE